MHLRLIAVGGKQPGWVQEGVDEYLRRLPREWKTQVVEVPSAMRGVRADIDKCRSVDGEHVLRAARGARLIALDEHGRELASREWATTLVTWLQDGRDVALAIGGPDGHGAEVLAQAEASWSLSRLTLPHGLVRVMLAEQLYRAWTIMVKHPYHRA